MYTPSFPLRSFTKPKVQYQYCTRTIVKKARFVLMQERYHFSLHLRSSTGNQDDVSIMIHDDCQGVECKHFSTFVAGSSSNFRCNRSGFWPRLRWLGRLKSQIWDHRLLTTSYSSSPCFISLSLYIILHHQVVHPSIHSIFTESIKETRTILTCLCGRK